jgi:hypothetical protein
VSEDGAGGGDEERATGNRSRSVGWSDTPTRKSAPEILARINVKIGKERLCGLHGREGTLVSNSITASRPFPLVLEYSKIVVQAR